MDTDGTDVEAHESNADTGPVSRPGATVRLRRAGQRVTPQRLVILQALERGGHLSADEVLAEIGVRLPGMTRSTVYRTLESFRDAGLVSETDLGEGVRKFELLDKGSQHHHLICHGCGVMLELDDAVIEPLRVAVREKYGFFAGIEHLAIFGWCAECDESRSRDVEQSRS